MVRISLRAGPAAYGGSTQHHPAAAFIGQPILRALLAMLMRRCSTWDGAFVENLLLPVPKTSQSAQTSLRTINSTLGGAHKNSNCVSVTGSSHQESMPATGGTSPADASTPHRRVLKKTPTGAHLCQPHCHEGSIGWNDGSASWPVGSSKGAKRWC